MLDTPSRRERLRAATMEEIHTVARRLLTTSGASGITLRAIGREMGMTAPALYRYYASLDDLLTSLCGQFYDECRDHIEAALRTADEDPVDRMLVACRTFRAWSTSHPAEFTMMFGSAAGAPIARPEETRTEHHDAAIQAGMRFAGLFMQLFVAMWEHGDLQVPADDEVDPSLREQFTTFTTDRQLPLPVGAVQAFTSSWIRLYGMVALDVFGHLSFCLTDSDPMFETELSAIARSLGIPTRSAT